jgi:hypothetical protein
MKRAHCQPTRSEEHVPPLPQPLPVGELITESKPTVLWKAEDIELLLIQELRGAHLPVIHLDGVQLLDLQGCCLGRVAGVSVMTTHGPLRTNLSGFEERGYRPSGPIFQRSGSHIAEAGRIQAPGRIGRGPGEGVS